MREIATSTKDGDCGERLHTVRSLKKVVIGHAASMGDHIWKIETRVLLRRIKKPPAEVAREQEDATLCAERISASHMFHSKMNAYR